MTTKMSIQNYVSKSPWLDSSKDNLFQYEFQLAKEDLAHPDFTPIDLYRWIQEHHGDTLFFKALAEFAPMFPVLAYNNAVASWISPPPSGLGNAIYIVMGHDKNGVLRLVGGNCFIEPRYHSSSALTSPDFFTHYDMASDREKRTLISDVISQNIRSENETLLTNVRSQCDHFHTMAIYTTVLTAEGNLFHVAPAVIEGDKPVDFSREHFGEIK